jgi:hypothetical protein
MKYINLLPKVPFIQRVFVPIMLVSAIFFLTIAFSLLFYSYTLEKGTNGSVPAITLLQASISKLTSQRQIDPLTKEVQALSTEVTKLKETRRDWLPFYELITSNLPKTARVLSAEVTDNEGTSASNQANGQAAALQNDQNTHVRMFAERRNLLIPMNQKFTDLQAVAQYTVLMQNSDLVDTVSVLSATRVQKQLASQTLETKVVGTPKDSKGSSNGLDISKSADKINIYQVVMDIKLKPAKQEIK